MSFSSTESKLHEKITLAVFKQEFSVSIFEYSFAKQLLLNTFHIFIEAFETAFSLLQLEPRTSLSLTADPHVFQRCFRPCTPHTSWGRGWLGTFNRNDLVYRSMRTERTSNSQAGRFFCRVSPPFCSTTLLPRLTLR